MSKFPKLYLFGGAETDRGLGILPSTIIEPHYSERNRHQQLRNEMKEVNAKYGIGRVGKRKRYLNETSKMEIAFKAEFR